MSNHVHLVVTPRSNDALALALKETHGCYATYGTLVTHLRATLGKADTYSCPLNLSHLWRRCDMPNRTPSGRAWFPWLRPTAGRVQPPIVELDHQTSCWRWTSGRSTGTLPTGGNIWLSKEVNLKPT